MSFKSEVLFKTILEKVRNRVTYDFLKSLKVKSGNTQSSERDIISVIRDTINWLGLTFSEAGSQQPYDFRIRLPGHETFSPTEEDIRNGKIYVGEEIAMLLLEVKKTDSNCIYFNDTCPSSQTNYIIISTGKIYSSAKRPELLPAVYGINGSDIIASSPWLLDFKRDIDALKEKYRETEGIMTVYPRPTYKANMDIIFKEHYETAKIAKLD